jgi:phosphoribosylaminoimidazolecarboxamide formyltransferase/IMP cyclohydrolase
MGQSAAPMYLPLRYGLNPDQRPARAWVQRGGLPLRVLGGPPSFINLLDALHAWQLVREMRAVFGLPAAASFKHVTPVGAALGLPLPPELAAACRVPVGGLSPLACAYARARGADRVASFGDFAACSDPVDAATAELLAREVSDGVVAPAYDAAALARLRDKQRGEYVILQVDPAWSPPDTERREVFGITLEQPRHRQAITLGEAVTVRHPAPEDACRDLLVAAITLRYKPSNSVCLAWDGQAVAVGAGQQSRIGCTRLACARAERWWLQRHPRTLALRFPAGTPRPARDNAVDAWLEGDADDLVAAPPLAPGERTAWLQGLHGLAMASDGLIPFRDNIDRAAQSGVAYVWQAGGGPPGRRGDRGGDQHGMVMYFSGQRLFQH